jgi:hypothetical protein
MSQPQQPAKLTLDRNLLARTPMPDCVFLITDPVAVAKALIEAARAQGLFASAPEEDLTADEACARLKVSKAKLNRLRASGMPCSYVGHSPRFNIEACKSWLSEKGKQSAVAAGVSEPVLLKRRSAP